MGERKSGHHNDKEEKLIFSSHQEVKQVIFYSSVWVQYFA